MVIQIQTSFVPKKAPLIGVPTSGLGGRHINLLALIALILFFLMVALSATVFFYKAHLIGAITGMDTALAAAKKSFEPAFIDEAARLDTRLKGAAELLNRHRALSPLFDLLEKKTLESVRFQDFTFTAKEGLDATLAMSGQAKSFNAVALESDVLGADQSFKDPIFSNFTLNDSGDVLFKFKTTLALGLLQYRETVLGSTAKEGGSNVPSVE